MGDMADYLIEQGQDAWDAHLLGTCWGGCQYCKEAGKKLLKEAKKLEKIKKEKYRG